ncbi:MAG: L,D-transpeptidase [Verrucomicrobiota bacterium]
MQSPGPRIEVSVADQTLRLFDPQNEILAEYPVSTSKFGLGTEEGSFKTPTGQFSVSDKFGGDEPTSTIFQGRKPVGHLTDNGPKFTPAAKHPADDDEFPNTDDLVVSRILWLHGIEDHNANTHDRYIYIHGTNHENLIGTPASHGCIRMRNADVAKLFDQTPTGTPVTIA